MKKSVFCLLLAAVLLLCSCTGAQEFDTAETWAYDTYCTVSVSGCADPQDAFLRGVKAGQTLLSPDGRKQYFAQTDGENLTVGDDLARILRMAAYLTEATGGIYDLTAAPLIKLWDVNHAQTPPAPERISEALSLCGIENVTLNGNVLTFARAGNGIDIGSVGKGWGADQTVRVLKEAGASAGVVNFGGNVALFGTKNGKPFQIGVRDPQGESTEYLGILSATDVSVVTSGAYERYFESGGRIYHHLLNAVTGVPQDSTLLSVTVLCADGAEADLLSTALWLSGDRAENLLKDLPQDGDFLPAQAVFVYEDRTVSLSGDPDFTLKSSAYQMR